MALGNDFKLFLGLGDGNFASPLSRTLQHAATQIACADFNGDGRWDLAVVSEDDVRAGILLNQGNGTFAESWFQSEARPRDVVAGDFNGDGHFDLAVISYLSDHVAVYLGHGNGIFTAATGPEIEHGVVVQVVAADFNGDGRWDLAVASSADAYIFLGTANGQFQAGQVLHVARTAARQGFIDRLAADDFNADGRVDLVFRDDHGNMPVYVGQGDGTFREDTETPLDGVYTFRVPLVTGDFNGDGRADVAAASDAAQSTIAVSLAEAGNRFAAPRRYLLENLVALAAGDFNQDGDSDLLAFSYSYIARELKGQLLPGHGDGAFQGQATVDPRAPMETLLAADLNHDGIPDLVTVTPSRGDVRVLPGVGDGRFQAPTASPSSLSPARWTADELLIDRTRTHAGATDTLTADFNGDGRLDMASTDDVTGTVHVLFGQGDGHFAGEQIYRVGANPHGLVAADFNGDGILDLAVANRAGDNHDADHPDLVSHEAGSVSILLGHADRNGHADGGFRPRQTLAVGAGPVDIVAADFNGDGRIDLATADYGSAEVSILLGRGNGTFAGQRSFAVAAFPSHLFASDMNRDGIADLVVASDGSEQSGAPHQGAISVLFASRSGRFSLGSRTDAVVYPGSQPVLADFNGDLTADLVARNRFYCGQPDGSFRFIGFVSPLVAVLPSFQPIRMATADFNRDGARTWPSAWMPTRSGFCSTAAGVPAACRHSSMSRPKESRPPRLRWSPT